MTFRALTELQEQSQNATHTSAITHRVKTNGWSQMDRSLRWIAAKNELRPEMDDKRWIPSG